MIGTETIFTYGAPQLKFGAGASDEIGYDLAQLGVTRVLVVTDPGVAATGLPERVAERIRGFGVRAEVYDQAHVEPTDQSLRAAIDEVRSRGMFDGFVAVGGGSAIDTAKAINLMTSCEGDLMDYINAPVGGGKAPTGPLKPLVAVPTTTGTGSESTTIVLPTIACPTSASRSAISLPDRSVSTVRVSDTVSTATLTGMNLRSMTRLRSG